MFWNHCFRMSFEEKFKIIRSIGEECILEDELLNLLIHKPEPICYDGFEPSGRMHIAQVFFYFSFFFSFLASFKYIFPQNFLVFLYWILCGCRDWISDLNQLFDGFDLYRKANNGFVYIFLRHHNRLKFDNLTLFWLFDFKVLASS